MERLIDTEQKASALNLNDIIFGTIAEIGAGQEVARHFFTAGRASATIAKTISAYDMTFSDEIYGREASGRYVCESRLCKMLDHEYQLLIQRLSEKRPRNTQFFAFADTVATSNYHGTQDGHGWLGVRFQTMPQAQPTEIVLHIRMREKQTLQQQKALGIIGINLIYACFYHLHEPETFVLSLMDCLTTKRIEIDMIHAHGPSTEHIDTRLLSLWLVKHGMTHAIIFDKNGVIGQPAEVLYKKNVFALRGSFRPPTHVNINMLEAGLKQFYNEEDVNEENSVVLTEITTNNLRSDGELCEQDFLARADLLAALGQNVLISNYHEYHRLSKYFARHTNQKVVMALGINNFLELFNEEYYQGLPGGTLQAFGELFNRNVKLYVYPIQEDKNSALLTLDKFSAPPHLKHLYHYLLDNNYLADFESFDEDILHIFSRKVLDKIKNNETDWGHMVPQIVEDTIRENCLFGFNGGHCQVKS